MAPYIDTSTPPLSAFPFQRNSVIRKYPPTEKYYTYFEGIDHTLTLPRQFLEIRTSGTSVADTMQKLRDEGRDVFLCQTRLARLPGGNIVDPWGRSIPKYKSNFKDKFVNAIQIDVKLMSNAKFVTLIWRIDTTVNVVHDISIFYWENVTISYKDKRRTTRFISDLHPMEMNKHPIYDDSEQNVGTSLPKPTL